MRAVEPGGRASGAGRVTRLIGRYLLLVVVAALVLFPVYAALMVAQKDLDQLGDLGVLVPGGIDVGAFPDAFVDASLGRYLVNSFVVAIAITLGQVVTSVLAGYAFALLDFAGKRLVFWSFLATLMVPFEVTIVVNFETIQQLGWIDTYRALILPFLAFAVGTFLLRQAFLGIPRDLRDAAAMDGYGHWGFLVRVGVHLVRPTIAALALFSFLISWNQYLWPLLVTNSDDRRTVQIGLQQLRSVSGAELNLVMAGTILAMLPILLLLILFERQLIRGLTAGALKG